MTEHIAHIRLSDGAVQTLDQHLIEVSDLAGKLAEKLGVPDAGKLIGLLHDFGKYSQSFQVYLKSAQGRIKPDEDEYVDAKSLKGKIDHSTAGAQYIWRSFSKYGAQGALCAQILSLCVASIKVA